MNPESPISFLKESTLHCMDLQIMRYWVSLQVQQDVPPVFGTEAVDTFEEAGLRGSQAD